MRIHLAIVDPEARWGQPLFVDDSGRPVYLGRGADGTDDDDEDGSDSGTDDDADADDDGDDKDKKDKDKKEAGAEADAEALRKKMRLADKRAAEAERKLRELEDKDKDALEVANAKVDELTKANGELNAKLKEQSLVSAFAMVNEHEWVDPEDALDLARRRGFLDDVQDEDGEVDQKMLKRKLAEFAKAKPNMIKKAKKDEDDGEDTAGGNGKGPTGTNTGSGRKKGAATGPTEEELRSRYSALRR